MTNFIHKMAGVTLVLAGDLIVFSVIPQDAIAMNLFMGIHGVALLLGGMVVCLDAWGIEFEGYIK